MEREFSIGSIVRIDTKTAFYQIVAKKDDEHIYIRQVFDKNLNLKLSKAELYHKNWIRNVSSDYNKKIATLLNENSDIKKQLSNIAFEPAFHYYTWLTTLYYIDDTNIPIVQKRLDELSKEPTNKKLNCLLKKLQREKLIKQVSPSDYIKVGTSNIYRLECGRYENDFDKHGKMSFRNARFYKIK